MHPLTGNVMRTTEEGYGVILCSNGLGDTLFNMPTINSMGDEPFPTQTLEGDTYYYSHSKNTPGDEPGYWVYARGIHVGDTVRSSGESRKTFVVSDILVSDSGHVTVSGLLANGTAVMTSDPIFVSERESSDPDVLSCKLDPNNSRE